MSDEAQHRATDIISRADDYRSALAGVRITRVKSFWHSSPRPKMVGRNAFHDVHGDSTLDYFLRIATDQGLEGVGAGVATEGTIEAMTGCTLDDFLHPRLGLASPLGSADHALYDLVGKVLGLPAWRLLGGAGEERVPIYDTSIYFNDLLPDRAGRGISSLLREVEASLERGHRSFKIKVGRGHKWMEPEEGFRRDLDVVHAIRGVVGNDIALMVDANNCYGMETAQRFLEMADEPFLFAEELFPENVPNNLALKAFIREQGLEVAVADGESAAGPEHFQSFIRHQALDVLQPDIRVFGLSRTWELARQAAGTPIRIATHNWGSWLALFPQLVVGRGIPNFLTAECDTGRTDLFDVSAYEFRDGRMRAPETPGCGIRIDEKVFRGIYGPDAWPDQR